MTAAEDAGELLPLAYVAKSYHEHVEHEGDVFDGYEPVEPYMIRLRPGRRRWSVHPHELEPGPGWESWRDEAAHRCSCGWRLVRIIVSPDGLRWALIKPERIPGPARRDDHDLSDDDTLTPLHVDQRGVPCLNVSSCRRCGRRWFVLIFEDGVELVQARLVGHGLRVAADRTRQD